MCIRDRYIVSASLKGVIKEKEISKYMAGTTSDLIVLVASMEVVIGNGSEHSCPTRQYPISQITGFRYRQYSYTLSSSRCLCCIATILDKARKKVKIGTHLLIFI